MRIISRNLIVTHLSTSEFSTIEDLITTVFLREQIISQVACRMGMYNDDGYENAQQTADKTYASSNTSDILMGTKMERMPT